MATYEEGGPDLALHRAHQEIERLSLALIEATNPGIDMDEVRRMRSAGWLALRDHFDRPDRRDSGEQVAHNALAVLRSLPVERRMEAMGMQKVGSAADLDDLFARGGWLFTETDRG